jgi:hypothetical protein
MVLPPGSSNRPAAGLLLLLRGPPMSTVVQAAVSNAKMHKTEQKIYVRL